MNCALSCFIQSCRASSICATPPSPVLAFFNPRGCPRPTRFPPFRCPRRRVNLQVRPPATIHLRRCPTLRHRDASSWFYKGRRGMGDQLWNDLGEHPKLVPAIERVFLTLLICRMRASLLRSPSSPSTVSTSASMQCKLRIVLYSWTSGRARYVSIWAQLLDPDLALQPVYTCRLALIPILALEGPRTW